MTAIAAMSGALLTASGAAQAAPRDIPPAFHPFRDIARVLVATYDDFLPAYKDYRAPWQTRYETHAPATQPGAVTYQRSPLRPSSQRPPGRPTIK